MAAVPTTSTSPTSLGSYENYTDPNSPVQNLEWVRQAFMLNTMGSNDITADDLACRIATEAAWNFTDTTLGGNWVLNPPAQFTEFADITMGGDMSQLQGMTDNRPMSSKRTTRTANGSYGMGRIYYEWFERNAQVVTMSFGVTSYNSLTSFFANFYDPRASQLVRTGRSTGAFFTLGQITGALFSIPFIPLVAGSSFVKSLLEIPATKYAYFKPTMTLYWNAVNTILNGITANLGIHSRQLTAQQKQMYDDPSQEVLNQTSGGQVTDNSSALPSDLEAEIAALHKFLPEVYTEWGGLDVYAIAGRAQQLATAHRKQMQQILETAADYGDLRTRLQNTIVNGNLVADKPQYKNISEAMNAYLSDTGGYAATDTGTDSPESMGYDASSGGGGASASSNSTTAPSNAGTSADTGAVQALSSSDQITQQNASTVASLRSTQANQLASPVNIASATAAVQAAPTVGFIGQFAKWFAQFWEGLKVGIHDGTGYVSLRTDYGGSIGESFSNSMRDSDLAQKINSMSSQSAMTSYDLAGGNIVGGAAGAVLDVVGGAVKDLINGALSGLQLSGVAALAGAAYVDIPKLYDSSSMSLPSQSFTIELRSWSGDKLSLLQNIYFPLSLLLAGVLPRSTGTQSYNGPFTCQIFAKGRMQSRFGMITNMSITRGVGNVGWTEDDQPLGIDVTFEVTDFSSVMHMPIVAQTGFFDKLAIGAARVAGNAIAGAAGANTAGNLAAQAVAGMYDDDSLFTDYLAILAGLGWRDQIYPFHRWSIYRDRANLNYESWKSPTHAANFFSGTLPFRVIQGLTGGTDRP